MQDRCFRASLLSFYTTCWCYCLRASFFRVLSHSLMHFCILPHEYATQRETYTSNKLSLDINRTLDFIKYFLFLTCCFFSLLLLRLSFFSSHLRKTTKEQNRKRMSCVVAISFAHIKLLIAVIFPFYLKFLLYV